jgi:hypothetical protein
MANQIPPAASAVPVMPAAPASGPHPMPSGEGTRAREDPVAVSPAIGPLPSVYVPPAPGQETRFGLLGQAMARAARAVGGWAARHRPDHRTRVRPSHDRDDH